MPLSTEAMIAIIALFTSLPATVYGLIQLCTGRHRMSYQATPEIRATQAQFTADGLQALDGLQANRSRCPPLPDHDIEYGYCRHLLECSFCREQQHQYDDTYIRMYRRQTRRPVNFQCRR
ncbi:hypothetical protein NLU13_9945 [Sarocladium strictum]|uniref:Uncharacterized protein n=1 Tax=Sarocladium strictum TaxID=5046 RepID=A0AA39L3Q0_SARSR|nr:hypothetical protein NLU13_9945 [Sarocladium strictum]